MSKIKLCLSFLFVAFVILSISVNQEFFFCQECGANYDVQSICFCGYLLFRTTKLETNAFSCFLDPDHQCKHDKKRFIEGSYCYLLAERHSKGNISFFSTYTQFDQDSSFFRFLCASQKHDSHFRNTISLLLSGQAQYPEWVKSESPPESELKKHIVEEYEKFRASELTESYFWCDRDMENNK